MKYLVKDFAPLDYILYSCSFLMHVCFADMNLIQLISLITVSWSKYLNKAHFNISENHMNQ